MDAVINIADVRAKRHSAVANILALAVEPVFQTLAAISDVGLPDLQGSAWPLCADACVAMVAITAEAMQPKLRSAGIDRAIMLQLLDEVRTAFSGRTTEDQTLRL